VAPQRLRALPTRPRLRMHRDNRDPLPATPALQRQALPKTIIGGDASVPLLRRGNLIRGWHLFIAKRKYPSGYRCLSSPNFG
jgi:hypothetical protein